MNRLFILSLSLLLAGNMLANEPKATLTLDSCRALALANNKALRMADTKHRAAHYERKAAFTHFMPRISATGTYMHTTRELSLLSDQQKETLQGLGTTLGAAVPSLKGMEGALNGVGQTLVDALHTDTRDMGAVGVVLTQPLYMGGKIAAYNRISRYAERVAGRQYDQALQEVIVEVDEAYWQIVSLQTRKSLAESYLKLVQQLDGDVQKMIEEGMATQADGLSVKVKVNEAEVALIQVTNGLSLTRMLLCQLCGLETDTAIQLADEHTNSVPTPVSTAEADVQTAFSHRPELDALSLSTLIYKEKIKLTRASFRPSVALTGNYMASNPSVFNTFERKMKGMWGIGVMVNVPLVTFGERCYKLKAARYEAQTAVLQWEETREKVELQVNQCRQKVQEAAERLQTAQRSRDEADENLRYARLGLQEGVIPLSNVLEAQTTWLKAHSEHVTAQIDLRLANLYLLRSTGTLGLDKLSTSHQQD